MQTPPWQLTASVRYHRIFHWISKPRISTQYWNLHNGRNRFQHMTNFGMKNKKCGSGSFSNIFKEQTWLFQASPPRTQHFLAVPRYHWDWWGLKESHRGIQILGNLAEKHGFWYVTITAGTLTQSNGNEDGEKFEVMSGHTLIEVQSMATTFP